MLWVQNTSISAPIINADGRNDTTRNKKSTREMEFK